MENFTFVNDTEIVFGKGVVDQLGSKIIGLGRRILLVYGGGSIVRSGLYNNVLKQLKSVAADIVELSGVEPNPRITSVRAGIEMCRQDKTEVILAVGGGSVIDCAKAISAGALYDGDVWDLIEEKKEVCAALPLVSVLTLAATGSEMNGNSVISDLDSKRKIGFSSPLVRPKISFLDPELTQSVSPYQTASGTADIVSHLLEVYFNSVRGASVSDRLIEGLLKTAIEYGPRAVEDGSDYEARANLMWTSTLALNGLTSLGKERPWICHPIEHQLSAYYDITHGAGLAIVTPVYLRRVLREDTRWKYVEFARNVFGLDGDEQQIAERGIELLEDFFFVKMKLPRTLKEMGVSDEFFLDMAADVVERLGPAREWVFGQPTYEDILAIYQQSFK